MVVLLRDILIQFLHLLWDVLPYFILGGVTGALVQVYVGEKYVRWCFSRGALGVTAGAVLGALLPGCSCATMPMADGLKRAGARLGVVAAFVLVSPLLSPHTLVLNARMLGWQFTIARLVLSLGAGVILGMAVNRFEGRSATVVAETQSTGADCAVGGCRESERCTRPRFWPVLGEIFKDLSVYFLLGLFIASVMMSVIPEESIPRYIGTSGLLAYAVAAAVGIPLYVCEGEEIPITRALLDLGLGAGPALTFLLGSVGTCIPTILMARKLLGRRVLVIYVFAWLVFAVGSGIVFGLLYRP